MGSTVTPCHFGAGKGRVCNLTIRIFRIVCIITRLLLVYLLNKARFPLRTLPHFCRGPLRTKPRILLHCHVLNEYITLRHQLRPEILTRHSFTYLYCFASSLFTTKLSSLRRAERRRDSDP